ncbi:MAG: hypothetical protein P9L98_05270 [Candidatus Kaelpia imicola]|nr:hypothetical protein [Candidatus Kaelpia imicola]
MSAFLIHSKDSTLAEIFLESQFKRLNPKRVQRYSFKSISFENIIADIFNSSLFEDRTLYFIDNAEALKPKNIAFLKEKIDFTQLKDSYIFNLISKTYWLQLPKWEGIKGLKVIELRFNPSDIKLYLEEFSDKKVSQEVLSHIVKVYNKSRDFKSILDAVSKVELLYPEKDYIDLGSLSEFLQEREPPEIKYLYEMVLAKDAKRSLETVLSLKEKGYKDERILLSLMPRFLDNVDNREADFIVHLEKSFKTGKKDAYSLILDLILFFTHREIFKISAGVLNND